MTKKLRKPIGIILTVLLLIGIAAGCAQTEKTAPPDQNDKNPRQTEKTSVTLYFSDKEALNLVAEVREVVKGKKTTEQLVIEELISGPLKAEHIRTVPAEAKLLAVEVQDKIATVDFSEEFVSKHWGGSTGESFTVYSIVNSLTELPEIESVQFLVKGKKIETLSGHMDLLDPIERNETLIKK